MEAIGTRKVPSQPLDFDELSRVAASHSAVRDPELDDEDLDMPLPIVIAHHLIWTVYGSWLPNDPRGSTSHFIHSDVIFDLGNLHQGRKKIQPVGKVIRTFYEEAKGKLKFPLQNFDAEQRSVIADAFKETIATHTYTCYACAIMPDHVHLLIRKHKHLAEEMISNLQETSRSRLRTPPFRSPDHPVWGGPGWKVFLDTPNDIRRTIEYIEDNPPKLHLPAQKWNFVRDYDGWPLHPGHSPNSPYAMRLRGRSRD